MPAANRPRRSPRVKPTEEIPEKEDPPLVIPKKKAKKSQSVKENEYDDLDDGSDGSSDDGDPVSKPWQKNKSKKYAYCCYSVILPHPQAEEKRTGSTANCSAQNR